MTVPAEVRETIRQARDEHARRNEHLDTRGRLTGGAGIRTRSFVDICFDHAGGDPLLALSFAADLVDRFGDPRGLAARHRPPGPSENDDAIRTAFDDYDASAVAQ